MAADVLAFNAIQEVNEELRAQIEDVKAKITDLSSGGGGGGAGETDLQKKIRLGFKQNPVYFGCLIPKEPAEGGTFNNGIKVCDASGSYRCGCNCTWTVPSGVTCARFQIWGPGSSSGTSCCCGVGMPGTSGAYASTIIPVTAGSSYTICSGCAYCCYPCWSNVQKGSDSYVQGTGLTNFCAQGGDNCYCRMVKDYGICQGLACTYNQFWCNEFFGMCPIQSNDVCLCSNIPASAFGYGRFSNRMQCPMIYNTNTCFFGSGDGDVYGYYGMYSQYFARDSFGFGIKYPPVYGFLGCWDDYERCCQEGCCRCFSGCWRSAANGLRYMPAAPGAIGIKCGNCQGEPWGDAGRMGMVCVQWKS